MTDLGTLERHVVAAAIAIVEVSAAAAGVDALDQPALLRTHVAWTAADRELRRAVDMLQRARRAVARQAERDEARR